MPNSLLTRETELMLMKTSIKIFSDSLCKMRGESSGVMSIIFKQTQYLEITDSRQNQFTASQAHRKIKVH